MGTHPIFESDFDCLTEYSLTGDGAESDRKAGKGPSGHCATCLEKQSIVKSGKKQTIKINLLEIGSKFTNHPDERLKMESSCFLYSISNAFMLFHSNQSESDVQDLDKKLAELRHHSKEKPIYLIYNKNYEIDKSRGPVSQYLKTLCKEPNAKMVKTTLTNRKEARSILFALTKQIKATNLTLKTKNHDFNQKP